MARHVGPQGAEVTELFPAGSPYPSSSTQQFSRKKAGSGLAVDMEVVQWLDGAAAGGGKSGKKGSPSSKGRWATVQRLGNPLAMQDDR